MQALIRGVSVGRLSGASCQSITVPCTTTATSVSSSSEGIAGCVAPSLRRWGGACARVSARGCARSHPVRGGVPAGKMSAKGTTTGKAMTSFPNRAGTVSILGIRGPGRDHPGSWRQTGLCLALSADVLDTTATPATGGGGDDDGGEGGHGGGGGGGGKGGGGGDGGGNPAGDRDGGAGAGAVGVPFLGALATGWKSRVDADPEFVFKVLTEQILGVGACVLGDMSTRPNFGLNELDFVFSTLVVGSIVNFALMYMLAPTGAGAARLPGIFASCPTGHMFEAGPYGVVHRAGTYIYKGVQFATVGFAAGLVGTSISKSLLALRQRYDPAFKLQNDPPPTFLNSATWALHMGLSSNARYQMLNGLDSVLVKLLPPTPFKVVVFAVRTANNVIGGSSFVILAKLTGAQSTAKARAPTSPSSTVVSTAPASAGAGAQKGASSVAVART